MTTKMMTVTTEIITTMMGKKIIFSNLVYLIVSYSLFMSVGISFRWWKQREGSHSQYGWNIAELIEVVNTIHYWGQCWGLEVTDRDKLDTCTMKDRIYLRTCLCGRFWSVMAEPSLGIRVLVFVVASAWISKRWPEKSVWGEEEPINSECLPIVNNFQQWIFTNSEYLAIVNIWQ